MIDLSRQIRDSLKHSRMRLPGPDSDNVFGAIAADDMHAALLAVLDLTEPGEPWPASAQDGRDYCEREIDAEVEARDARIIKAIAAALGIEADDA